MARVPKGVPGLGLTRIVAVPEAATRGGLNIWLVVADAPPDRFDEVSINRNISNLDWVSRAAVAHEAVVESFVAADAVLPMKLFTIFSSDARAVSQLAGERAHLERVLRRVLKHDEWGVRVVLDRARAERAAGKPTRGPAGASYLAVKKARRDAKNELVERSKEVVADLFDRLSGQAGQATRRAASEMPMKNGPLLLDAAFLVPRARTTRFRTALTRQAKLLQQRGYLVTLSGPWPPYSFMQDA
jgi:hypothetical protein